ncbi:hypothetical protein DV515_00017021, partial [Chloebia gouldiae]
MSRMRGAQRALCLLLVASASLAALYLHLWAPKGPPQRGPAPPPPPSGCHPLCPPLPAPTPTCPSASRRKSWSKDGARGRVGAPK